jgi:hypothetical protein
MVSSITSLQFNSAVRPRRSGSVGCNLSAAGPWIVRAAVIACFAVALASSARAQGTDAPPAAQQNEHRVLDSVKFVAGGGLGLVMHESGHLFFDAVFGADVRVEAVHLGPFPFFAISHQADVSPRQEFTISSAGFWVQEATSEWLLTTRPHIRDEKDWLANGVLAFNVLTSIGYGIVAFARAGPYERDTRGMADGVGVDERAIGALVIAPAVLDAYRYFRPEARWAKWASRAAKAGSVLLVLKQTSSSPR